MNYLWLYPRADFESSWVLDYSWEAWPTLYENHLNEKLGIQGHAGHKLKVGMGAIV